MRPGRIGRFRRWRGIATARGERPEAEAPRGQPAVTGCEDGPTGNPEWLLAKRPIFAVHLADALDACSEAFLSGGPSARAFDQRLASYGDDPDLYFDEDVHRGLRWLFTTVLHLSNPGATEAAARLVARPAMFDPTGQQPAHYQRALDASAIVALRPAAELRPLLEESSWLRTDDPELGLLLVHEGAVRGAPQGEEARWFLQWAASTGHPLAVLPARLSPPESLFPDRSVRFSAAGGMSAVVPGTGSAGVTDWMALGEVVRRIGEEVQVDRARIAAPFREWMEDNGRVQVTGYRTGRSLPADTPGLGLNASLPIREVTASAGLATLFSAVGGGAYTEMVSGSYARLRVWESVAGIFDLPWPSPIDGLARAAEDARWLAVRPDGAWFYSVWAVWLLIETSDRIVSITATDTD
jgi:hypothetical protein